jgi:quercetin dioxygenase-like cupin family protein
MRVAAAKFDERNIEWRQLEGFDDLWFYVYGVDREKGIVDAIFKFAANSKAMLHQHKTPYITLVLQGELRFYRSNNELKEVRPVGSYVVGIANAEPHLEGGGDEDAIVFFSFRKAEDVLFVFLNEAGEPVLPLGIGDFEEQFAAQGLPKWQKAA